MGTDTVNKHVVIGDVHGNSPKLTELFSQLEIPTDKDERAEQGIEVIQLGDFINMGYDQPEAEFYAKHREWIDVYLMGNHEYPIIAPSRDRVTFWGWEARDQTAELMYRDDWNAGINEPIVAHTVGDWIISHAGISTQRLDGYIPEGMVPQQVANLLNERFVEHTSGDHDHRVMFDTDSGVLWARGLHYEYDDQLGIKRNPYKQIIGHTPQTADPDSNLPHSYVDQSGMLFIIDIGCKPSYNNGIAAMVTEDEGETWSLFEVSGKLEESSDEYGWRSLGEVASA
jgi:hypothetical protein